VSDNLVQLGGGGGARRGRLGETPRLVLTLAVAGLLSGIAIVGAYEATLPRIEANKAAALRRAVFKVLPGATRMQRLAWRGNALVPAEGGGGEGAAEPSIYAAYGDDGHFVGYAVPTEGAGFQDTIGLLYGYDPARQRIVGMQVLESRETPGLGDKIFSDKKFLDSFHDLAVAPRIDLTKEKRSAPNQVDAITGATISSTAVVKIVNAADDLWLPRLPPAGANPPAPAAGAPSPTPARTGGPVPGGRLGGASTSPPHTPAPSPTLQGGEGHPRPPAGEPQGAPR
jgi:H+/Na+-translocating ferredoxin:NAD+ oxidoreductase subunit G